MKKIAFLLSLVSPLIGLLLSNGPYDIFPAEGNVTTENFEDIMQGMSIDLEIEIPEIDTDVEIERGTAEPIKKHPY